MAKARWWQKTALCRYYALAVAVALISLGLGGVLRWEWRIDLYYVVLGFFFAYPGLFVRDREGVRQMVEGLGVLLVLVVVSVVVVLLLMSKGAYWGPIEMVPFVVVGVVSVLAAKILRDIQTNGRVR